MKDKELLGAIVSLVFVALIMAFALLEQSKDVPDWLVAIPGGGFVALLALAKAGNGNT